MRYKTLKRDNRFWCVILRGRGQRFFGRRIPLTYARKGRKLLRCHGNSDTSRDGNSPAISAITNASLALRSCTYNRRHDRYSDAPGAPPNARHFRRGMRVRRAPDRWLIGGTKEYSMDIPALFDPYMRADRSLRRTVRADHSDRATLLHIIGASMCP